MLSLRVLRCYFVPVLAGLFLVSFAAFASPGPVLGAPVDVTTAIIGVAKKNIPAVAHIEVTERKEVPNPLLPFEKDPFFRYFFGNRKMPKKLEQEIRGLGSGIIMDTKGHILTSYHVAGGATKIEVQLSNGNRYTAKVVGGDPKTDLAVIRIEAKESLPVVAFGDSDKVEIGEWVIAIGHPRGLDQTVTQGIISAKHRRGILDPSTYQDFLQTDASINPGNSGGPLLNLRGEVIGINTAIATESGGSEGIGFAVPSNIAVHIAKTLIATGKVERGWFGVSVRDLTLDKAQSLGLKYTRGALVVDTLKGSPADRAGIKADDVILGYQGKEIPDASALQNAVAMSQIGSQVKVTFWRGGKQQDVTVRIGSAAEAAKALSSEATRRLGAEFREMTAAEAGKLGLESGQGVVVSKVEPKGPLGRAGFESGDVILAINGQKVVGVESLGQLVSVLPPKQQITVLAADLKKGTAGTVKVTVP